VRHGRYDPHGKAVDLHRFVACRQRCFDRGLIELGDRFELFVRRRRARGLEVTWPPTDMPWNVREMHVRHPDGHVFRISKQIEEE